MPDEIKIEAYHDNLEGDSLIKQAIIYEFSKVKHGLVSSGEPLEFVIFLFPRGTDIYNLLPSRMGKQDG